MHLATRAITFTFTLATAAAALSFAPRSAPAANELTGLWEGSFEFITIGERAAYGPAASLEGKRRSDSDGAPTFGEGEVSVVVENQFDEHFFGRWQAGGRKGDIVCTMMDERRFLCGGRETNVVGHVVAEDALRMCWSASGKNATAGCADLTRPD